MISRNNNHKHVNYTVINIIKIRFDAVLEPHTQEKNALKDDEIKKMCDE